MVEFERVRVAQHFGDQLKLRMVRWLAVTICVPCAPVAAPGTHPRREQGGKSNFAAGNDFPLVSDACMISASPRQTWQLRSDGGCIGPLPVCS